MGALFKISISNWDLQGWDPISFPLKETAYSWIVVDAPNQNIVMMRVYIIRCPDFLEKLAYPS
jgi:hypothetical protein